MAVKFLTANNGLKRTTNLVQGNTNYTGMVWFRPDVDLVAPDYQTVVAFENGVPYEGMYSDVTDNNKYKLQLNNNAGSGDRSSTGTLLTAGHWYPLYFQRNGTFHLFTISGFNNASLTPFNMATVTFGAIYLGWDGAGANKGTFAYFREWNAVLSATQLLREFNSRVAVRTANLVTDTPLGGNLLDLTAAHNDWVANGGVLNTDYKFVTDDPIPAGCVVAEAVDMGNLPINVTIDQKPNLVEFIFDRWYKYTSVAPEIYIGGWFFGDLSNYKINYAVYSDAGITAYPPPVPIAAQNVRFQMPVVNAHTYYFAALAQFNDLSTHQLTVDFLTAPNKAVPDGSYLINDDQTPFYSAILSSLAGDDFNVLRFKKFVNTLSDWAGDVSQLNGNIFVSDDATLKMKVYNPQFSLLVDTGITSSATTKARKTSNGISFYVGELLQVHKVSNTGVVGGTVWNLAGTKISALAANAAETILYVAVTNVANAPVKQWDLVNSVYLADLVAGIATYFVTDMIVLADNSILVLHVKNGLDVNVHRYSAAGALLNTYAMGAASTVSMSYDFSDPANYFLIRLQDLAFSGQSIIRRVKLSDGTFTQVQHVRYEDGIYVPAATATPLAKFGISISCPFFPVRAFTVNSGIYKLQPNKRQDTLWDDLTAKTTHDVAIPNPFVESAALGQ